MLEHPRKTMLRHPDEIFNNMQELIDGQCKLHGLAEVLAGNSLPLLESF